MIVGLGAIVGPRAIVGLGAIIGLGAIERLVAIVGLGALVVLILRMRLRLVRRRSLQYRSSHG